MTIEYLSFVCFVGRLLLDHSDSSSSSSMKSSFLIQMIRWIRGSSRIEFFIFLITLNGESLIFNLLPSFFFSSYETSFFFFPESIESNYFLFGTHSSHEWIPWSWEAILCFFFYHFKMLCILDLHILQLFSQIHVLNYVLIFK